MALDEIVLLETKPETEWVRGRALQKVSPTFTHSQLQGAWLVALTQWSGARARGRVGVEWRFRVAPPGEIIRPLVPDVAYISFDRLPLDAPREAIETPLAAPTVAVEVLSPDDRPADVNDKIATYLRAGTSLVVIVDPRDQTVRAHDTEGTRVFGGNDIFAHPALAEFTLDLRDMFERARR